MAQSTFHLKEADYEKGQWVFETINAVQGGFTSRSDRIRTGHELGLGYGVTEWWLPKILISFDKPDHDSLELQRVMFENVLTLRPLVIGKDGFGLGWFHSIEGALHDDQTNATIFGPIIAGQSGHFSFASDVFLEKTFGQNHTQGIDLLYALQLRYEVLSKVKLGMEIYGRLPEIGADNAINIGLENRVGPVLIVEFDLPRGMSAASGAGAASGSSVRGLKAASTAGRPPGSDDTPQAEIEMGVLFGTTAYTPGVAGKVNMHVKF